MMLEETSLLISGNRFIKDTFGLVASCSIAATGKLPSDPGMDGPGVLQESDFVSKRRFSERVKQKCFLEQIKKLALHVAQHGGDVHSHGGQQVDDF